MDCRILGLLHGYAWMTNNALPEVVGCSVNVSWPGLAACDLGVISRFYQVLYRHRSARSVTAAVGNDLGQPTVQCVRGTIRSFIQQIRRRRHVMDMSIFGRRRRLHPALSCPRHRRFARVRGRADADVAGTRTSLRYLIFAQLV